MQITPLRNFATKRIKVEDLSEIQQQREQQSLIQQKNEQTEKLVVLVNNLKYFIDNSAFERAEQFFKQITEVEGINLK